MNLRTANFYQALSVRKRIDALAANDPSYFTDFENQIESLEVDAALVREAFRMHEPELALEVLN